MGSIRLETRIAAPAEVCFDLARSVEAHVASTARSGERAVAGKTHGLLELGDSVTREATFEYRLPARVFGRVADRLVIERYLTRFLSERADFLKAEAERSGSGR